MRSHDRCAMRPAILAVDDRQENLLALGQLLEGADAELLYASSGQQAVEISLARSDIAVILLDVHMPGMDGFETAEALRLNDSTWTIPVIFVTAASSDAEDVLRGYACGAVDFITKPIPEHVLRSKVDVFLELVRQQKALVRALSELEQSKVELERSNTALHDFSHAAAHDLRAPVRHISTWASMILADEGETLSDKAAGRVRDIQKFAARMHELISCLLEYARVDASPPVMSAIALNGVSRTYSRSVQMSSPRLALS